MKIVTIATNGSAKEKVYIVFRREDEYGSACAAYYQEHEENVLVARRCKICGDYLLGTVEDPETEPECEPEHHGSRPGVYY